MAIKTPQQLKDRFQSQVEVNEQDFADVFDSYIPISGGQPSIESNGTAIQFDQPRDYGVVTPETGNITLNAADAVLGMEQLIIHNSGTEPTFGIEFVIIGGSYVTSVDNYILMRYVSATKVLVTISQEV